MNIIKAIWVLDVFVCVVALFFATSPVTAGAAFQYQVQVTNYGALCDGIHDDTSSIVSAIAAAGPGGTVQFPAGVCVIDLTGTRPADTPIILSDVALVGTGVPHFSDSTLATTEAGTFISIGTSSIPPLGINPFYLQHSVTIRGINFVYPNVISYYQRISPPPTFPPPVLPSLFSDDGVNEVSNILFENVHVVAAYDFWAQQGGGSTTANTVTYGNIRFVDTDVYALNSVFIWANVQETVSFSNFLSNPSLCSGNFGNNNMQCTKALEAWTGDNGAWLHVVGGKDATSHQTDVAGLQASNLTVAGYEIGVLVDSNGHLDESMFGSGTVFDTVPNVLYVDTAGSITHTVFSGKSEFSGRTLSGTPYSTAAFILNNPQHPLSTDRIQDHNTLSLNGFTADGIGGPLLSATVTGSPGDIGSIAMVGVVGRHYCDGGASTNAVSISAPKTAVLIVGSQITSANKGCGGLSVTASPYAAGKNVVGYYPNN